MVVAAIRGAVTVSENNSKEIEEAAVQLINEIKQANNLSDENIVFIIFTCTADLDSAYPAAGLRKKGFQRVPLLCAAEMPVRHSLAKCIRVMLLANMEEGQRVRHVYLKDAKKLRPDLSEG